MFDWHLAWFLTVFWTVSLGDCEVCTGHAGRGRRPVRLYWEIRTAAPMDEEQRTFWGCAGCKGGMNTVVAVYWQSWQDSQSEKKRRRKKQILNPGLQRSHSALQGVSLVMNNWKEDGLPRVRQTLPADIESGSESSRFLWKNH